MKNLPARLPPLFISLSHLPRSCTAQSWEPDQTLLPPPWWTALHMGNPDRLRSGQTLCLHSMILPRSRRPKTAASFLCILYSAPALSVGRSYSRHRILIQTYPSLLLFFRFPLKSSLQFLNPFFHCLCQNKLLFQNSHSCFGNLRQMFFQTDIFFDVPL